MRITTSHNAHGMSSSSIVRSHAEAEQLHDDHAVTTVILQHGYANDIHSHDEGLVHSHEWATSAPMTR